MEPLSQAFCWITVKKNPDNDELSDIAKDRRLLMHDCMFDKEYHKNLCNIYVYKVHDD